MKNLVRYSVVLLAILCWNLPMQDVQAQGVPIQGTVTNAVGQPLPGLTVSLFHPLLGRSSPSITDGLGRYAMYGVPIHPDPYYIEVYWGGQLVYRAPIQVQAPVVWAISIR